MLVIMGAAPNDCIILVIHQTGGGGVHMQWAQLPRPCSTCHQGPEFWAPWIGPQPRGWEGRLLQTQLVTLFSVPPERFGEPPLSRSLHGPSAGCLQNPGSQKG